MNLNDIKEELDIHIKRINSILPEIEASLPLTKDSFDDIEIVKSIDSFIFRLAKVQDKMGEKLFPLILQKLEEYKPKMPLIDILNKLEQLELISSANDWIEYRKLRNLLTHEYPDNTKEMIEAIEKALTVYKEMIKIFERLLKIGMN